MLGTFDILFVKVRWQPSKFSYVKNDIFGLAAECDDAIA